MTGHSLGGSLAQRYAINFPGSIQQVVTFNAAGISPSEVNNFKQNGGGSFTTTHYVVEGDAVSLAGQFIPGDAYLMSFTTSYDFWNKHNKIFVEGGLLNNPDVRANPLPVDVLNSPNFHYSNPGYVATVFVLSRHPLLHSIGKGLTNRGSAEGTRSLIGNVINLFPGQK